MKNFREIIVNAKPEDKRYGFGTLKAVDASRRIIEGFISTKFIDRDSEVVDPMALLNAMPLYMAKTPVVLASHDSKDICCNVGKCLSYQGNADGVYCRIEIMPESLGAEMADEVWKRIEFGSLNAFSIGFIPRDVDFSGPVPVIKELELLEISIVSIPCNREALFSIAKAFGMGTAKEAKQTIGWDKTKASLLEVRSVVLKNAASLPTEDKIFVESILKELQTAFNTDSEELTLKNEIEALELQSELDTMESELKKLV